MAAKVLEKIQLFWMPNKVVGDGTAKTERAKLLILLVTITAGLILLFSPFLLLYSAYFLFTTSVLSAGGMVATLLVLKRTGNVDTAAITSLVFVELLLTTMVVLSGGLNSPILWWHAIVPMASAILINKRYGVIVGMYSLLLFSYLHVWDLFKGHFPNLLVGELKSLASSFSFVSMTLTCVLFIFLYRQMNESLYKYVDNIFRYISDILIVTDDRCAIKVVNQQTLNLLNYSEAELINKPIQDLMDNSAFNPSQLRDIVESGELNEVESFLLTKDKKRVPVAISGNILRNKTGSVVGIIISAKDTRESRIIQELRQTQSQLVQSGKLAALGELSSGLAHELNNPLFLIKGFNQRISTILESKGSVTKDDIGEHLDFVEENCGRMQKIIQHFREFSRSTGGEFKPVSVNTVINKSFILMSEQLRMKNIIVTKELCPDNPIILGDETRFEQIFINLLTNSRDAIEEKKKQRGGEVSVKVRSVGNVVTIEVVDNGPGIDAEKVDKIFDPFFTTKEVGKGTGLGLSITHGLVKELKGQISVRSKKGEGTSFLIAIPMIQEEHKELQHAS